MRVVKARYDGKQIVLPKEAKKLPAGEVLVVFEDGPAAEDEKAWAKAQEEAFARAWDNDEDAEYDRL